MARYPMPPYSPFSIAGSTTTSKRPPPPPLLSEEMIRRIEQVLEGVEPPRHPDDPRLRRRSAQT